MSKPRAKRSTRREWIESILIALALAIFIRSYFIQPFKIPSGSMRPTLIEGDHLFVGKLPYGPVLLPEWHLITGPLEVGPWVFDVFGWQLSMPHVFTIPFPSFDFTWPKFLQPLTKIRLPGYSKPQREDVVVFIYPDDRSKDFIKRLIGLPGDVVEIREGRVYINGRQAAGPRTNKIYYYNRGDYGAVEQPVKIPEGKYFMLGDNSGASHDSRYWGFVDEKDLVGKAQLIFWPPNRWRFIQ